MAARQHQQQSAGQQTEAPRSFNLGSMQLAYKSLHICALRCGALCCYRTPNETWVGGSQCNSGAYRVEGHGRVHAS